MMYLTKGQSGQHNDQKNLLEAEISICNRLIQHLKTENAYLMQENKGYWRMLKERITSSAA